MGGHIEQSVQASKKSVELYEGLAAEFPDLPDLRNELAQAQMFLGHVPVSECRF